MKVRNSLIFGICCVASFDAVADIDMAEYCVGASCNLIGGIYFNTGIVNSQNISIDNNTSVSIKNSGTISSSIVIPDTSDLTQIIESPQDIKHINIAGDGDFYASVVGGVFSFNDIVNTLEPIQKLYLSGTGQRTELVLSGNFDSNKLQNTFVEINGDVYILVKDDFDCGDRAVLYNIKETEWEDLHFETDSDNPLYFIKPYWKNNNVYLTYARTINYEHLFNDSRGMFLNYLRVNSLDDGLINRLDSESDTGRFMDIINNSVRLNPDLLMRSVHEINVLEMTTRYINHIGFDVGIEPVYMFSDHSNTIGGRLIAKYSLDKDLYVGASGYVYKMHFDDGLNKYNSGVYGGNVRIDYVGAVLFARGAIGANIDKFDVGPVLNGDEITNNPIGNSFYGFADFGKHFDIGNDGWYIAPFVTVGMETLKILQNNKNEFFARGAFDGGYSFVNDSMQYNYNLRVGVNTDGKIDAAFNFDAWSEIDSAGGGVSFGIIQTDLGVSGKASINLHMVF